MYIKLAIFCKTKNGHVTYVVATSYTPILLIAAAHRSRSPLLMDVITMVGFGLLLRVFIVCAELDEDASPSIVAGFDEDNDDDDGCGCCDGFGCGGCGWDGGGMGVAVAAVAVVVVAVVDVLLFVEAVVVEDDDEDVERLGLERLPPNERRFRRRGVVLDEPNDCRDDFTGGGAVSPTKKSALIWALICSLRSRISFVTTGF